MERYIQQQSEEESVTMCIDPWDLFLLPKYRGINGFKPSGP
jgi:hypothetical protein